MPVPLARRCVRMGPMAELSTTHPSQIRAWLQLMRIANLPTAISNVAAGAILPTAVHGTWNGWFTTKLVVMATIMSAFLYTSGMILNDAFDAHVDSVERPNRPIPSGRIPRATALKAGYSLMGFAIAAPIALLLFQMATDAMQHLNTLLGLSSISILLAGFIILYNGPLKRTWLAAPAMGTCRALNILLGASITAPDYSSQWYSSFYDQSWFWYSLSIGLFVCGITLLARSESKQKQSRLWLGIGATTMLAAVWMLASHIPKGTALTVKQVYWAMLSIIAFPIVRRLFVAVKTAKPPLVGAAIVASLSSLIFLDAAVCFLVRPDQPLYAGAVALLIVPLMILRKFSAQT